MLNWNKEHYMTLPDMKDFPDCSVLPSIDEDEEILLTLSHIESALKKNNKILFAQLLKKLSKLCLVKAPNEVSLKIWEEQYSSILQMGRQSIDDRIRKNTINRIDLKETDDYHQLNNLGYISFKISTKRLRKLLKSKINSLLSQNRLELNRGYDRSLFLNAKDDAAVFQELNRVYSKQGKLDAIAKYHHCKSVSVRSVCLHVCSPEDTHYLQTLKDCDTIPKLVGLHFDPKYVMKSLVYLNEVDLESGPFSFVPGSHRWWFDDLERIFAKGVSIGNYLNSPEHRLVAMQLPTQVRKNSIVGRFIPDDSELSNKLLADEKKFLSKDGNCIIFDPSTGFHRGGICSSGKRINLQIIFG